MPTIPRVLLHVAVLALAAQLPGAAVATTYLDGVSDSLAASPPDVFDLGTHRPSYIGGTTGSAGEGTALDGNRVYFFDNTGSTDDPQTATPFGLLVWEFAEPKDSLRLYTHQDHLSADGLVDTDFEAQDVMEYSVFGCNGPTGGCTDAADWVFLSDVVAYTGIASGKPTYTFAGTEAAYVYRGGSTEFGLVNAYTRDYVFDATYNFYGMRASTVSFLQSDADPELDAVVAFNRDEVNLPEPGSVLLLGAGLVGLAARQSSSGNGPRYAAARRSTT